MQQRDLETIPVGSLGIIPLKGCEGLSSKINDYIVDWRNERESEHKSTIAFTGYQRDNYIVKADVPRFGSGEAKGVIRESVRGYDLYLLVDVCNYSLTYTVCGMTNHMSPDDHYQDLKRIIAAVGGKARRITVIMPFLSIALRVFNAPVPPFIPPLLIGVGQNCDSFSFVRGIDTASRNNKRLAGVACAFQVSKHRVECHIDDSRHIFTKHPRGPEFFDNSAHFWPEVTVIFLTSSLPSKGKWLAWEPP